MRLGLGLGLTRQAGGAAAPVNVLANDYGLTWIWGVDPAFATLSQDTAGATAVTAAGQPVGRATDGAGTDHLIRLVNDTLRPTYRVGPKRLQFDGDGMATAGNVALGAPTTITVVIVGDLPSGDAGDPIVISTEELNGTDTPNGAWAIHSNSSDMSVVARQSPSSQNVQTTRISGVSTARQVHCVSILNAATTVVVNWRQGASYAPLSTSVGFTNRTGGGAFADRRIRVGSKLDGTRAMTGGLAFIGLLSGQPTEAQHAALVADLIGRV